MDVSVDLAHEPEDLLMARLATVPPDEEAARDLWNRWGNRIHWIALQEFASRSSRSARGRAKADPRAEHKGGLISHDESASDDGDFLSFHSAKARKFARHDASADDVCQEVFEKLVLVARSGSYDPSGSFKSFIITITRNRARTYIRDASSAIRAPTGDFGVAVGRDDVDLVHERDSASDDAVERHDLIRVLDHAEETLLSEKLRRAFDLVERQGLSSIEAGAILDVPPATVRTRAATARNVLRVEVEWRTR